MIVAELKNGKCVYRDATQDEIAEMEKAQAEIPEPEPTPEERLEALEEQQERTDAAVQELILSALGGE